MFRELNYKRELKKKRQTIWEKYSLKLYLIKYKLFTKKGIRWYKGKKIYIPFHIPFGSFIYNFYTY